MPGRRRRDRHPRRVALAVPRDARGHQQLAGIGRARRPRRWLSGSAPQSCTTRRSRTSARSCTAPWVRGTTWRSRRRERFRGLRVASPLRSIQKSASWWSRVSRSFQLDIVRLLAASGCQQRRPLVGSADDMPETCVWRIARRAPSATPDVHSCARVYASWCRSRGRMWSEKGAATEVALKGSACCGARC